MKNGWTGGQYSLYRICFGLFLANHFVMLLPYGAELFSSRGVLPGTVSPLLRLFPNLLAFDDSPATVALLLAAGAVASSLFAIGWFDRIGAIAAWYVLACLFGRNPLIGNPSLPFLGWLLLAHAALPAAPYGSLRARGRTDPDGGWRMPGSIFAAAWIVMGLAYSYSGYAKLMSPSWVDGTAFGRVLENPLARPSFVRDMLLAAPPPLLRLATWGALGLELAYAPLALFRRVRPFLWIAMAGMHLGLMVLVDFAELSAGMLVLHFFTFDPGWVKQRFAGRRDRMFYDGGCGLCHRLVRFVLAEDRGGGFIFAPLQGPTFAAAMPPGARTAPSDSVVLQTEGGEVLIRSAAVLYILSRLGGLWRVVACLLRVVPRRLRDALYDFVARTRNPIFGRVEDRCPVMPAVLRSRFLD